MRILVIEDEQKVASFIQRGLTAEQYSVDVAHDEIDGGGHPARPRKQPRFYPVAVLTIPPDQNSYRTPSR